jgi:hypothetical protein
MKISQESDHVPGRRVITVTVVAIVISAVGILGAWLIVTTTAEQAQPALRGTHQPMAREIYDKDRWLFAERGELAGRRGDIQRLSSYGWVDEQKGVIHMPIRRAMELYLASQGEATHTQSRPGPTRPEQEAPEASPEAPQEAQEETP